MFPGGAKKARALYPRNRGQRVAEARKYFREFEKRWLKHKKIPDIDVLLYIDVLLSRS
jgi:hypothetical protein